MNTCSNDIKTIGNIPCDTKVRRMIVADKLPVYSEDGEQIGFIHNPDFTEDYSVQFFNQPPAGAIHKALTPNYEGLKLTSFVCRFIFK